MRKILALILFLGCIFCFKSLGAELKHSYTFENGTANDVVGSVNGTVNGSATMSNGSYTNLSNGYISFDGAALALNTYSAITLEAYIQASNGLNVDGWASLANFGTNGDNHLFMSNTRGGWIGTTAYAKAGASSCEIAFHPKKDDGLLHHLVTVLSGNVLKLYLDGVLLESKSGAPNVADLGTSVAYLGKSMWGWEPLWKGSICEFNIYDGELNASEIAANNTVLYNATKSSFESISTAASIILSAGGLNSSFNPSVTTYSASLPSGTTSVTPSVLATSQGATISGNGTVDVSSGSGTSTITINAIDGQSSTIYTINYTVALPATIRHSYKFNDSANDTPGSGITAVNGTLNGTASVSNGVLTLGGGWVSFDGAALNLNSYSNGITLEYYIKPTQGINAGHWNWLSYFGGVWGFDCLMAGANTWGQYRFTKNNYGDGAIEVNNTDDGNLHHFVTVLFAGKLKMYADGVKIGEVAASTTTIGTDIAYLGRAFWDDPSWLGKIDEFNIYESELTADQVAVHYQAMANKNVTSAETAALNMYKNVVVRNGGGLTLSTPTSIENLKVQSGGTLLDNGNLTSSNISIQQYIPSGRNWYISSPVTNATSAVIDAANVSNKLYWYDQAHGTTAPWAQITDNTTNLSSLQGYITNVALSDTLRFNGPLNTGEKSITLHRTTGQAKEGFNLIGNPYPSYVSWDAAEKSNMESTMWYRTKNAGNTVYVFDTYNSAGQIGTGLNGEQINCNIPPLQAFWVRVKPSILGGDTIGSVTFRNTMRSHKGSQTVGQTTTPDVVRKISRSETNIQKVLRLQIANGDFKDEAIVVFNENALNTLDEYDSYKMFNNNVLIPEIYTISDATDLTINGLTNIESNAIIPLGFKTGQRSEGYTITSTQLSNFGYDQKVYLKDNLLNIEQELGDGQHYTFTSDPVATNTRFAIIFKSQSITTDVSKNTLDQLKVSVNSNNQLCIYHPYQISENSSFCIFNSIGQKIEKLQPTVNATTISNVLPAGVYVLAIQLNGVNKSVKVLVK